jgi:hypothetical protein
MRSVAPFVFLVVAATAAPRGYPSTQDARTCDAVRTNSTVELKNAVSSLLAHTTASGDFPKALAALLANATGDSGPAIPEGGAGSSTGASDDSSTPTEVTGGGPEVPASDSGRLPALTRGIAWLRGSDDDLDDTSDDASEDASDDAPDDPIYAPSRRPAAQDRSALSPAAAGRAATTNAPSPAQVAAGSAAGLQSAEHGVNIANDVLRGGAVSDAVRDGALAAASGADAADIAGPPPSVGGGSSRAAGGPPSLPRLSPADVAAGANAVAEGAGVASAIGNLAGNIPRPPPPPGRGSLGGLRGIGSGRGPLVGGGLPGLGRLPGGFRRLGGGLRKRQPAQP